MDRFRITGGAPLAGEATAAGAKNAALPLMAAVLLTEGRARLGRVPRLRDVDTMAALLEALGVGVERDGGEVALEVRDGSATEAPYDIVRRMRASICVLGPLVARRGAARVSLPGGCVFGPRPVDLHVRGLRALGARVELRHGVLEAEAPPGGLRGARLDLRSPRGSTVLGTANVMMAATLARGESVIEGAAREPEIAALGNYLRACGAEIEGLGTERIRVTGQEGLRAAEGTVPPDRIETGTLLLAAAATGGRVRVTGCTPDDLPALTAALRAAGVPPERGEDWIEVDARAAAPVATAVRTAPFPGFPTDLQAQWTAFAARCAGVTEVRDDIYPERFVHVAELERLGMPVERGAGWVRVRGPARLSGAPVMASDLRASAALVLAGLMAEGETLVRRVYHLDRGYEGLEEKLRGLGGDVRREVDDQKP